MRAMWEGEGERERHTESPKFIKLTNILFQTLRLISESSSVRQKLVNLSTIRGEMLLKAESLAKAKCIDLGLLYREVCSHSGEGEATVALRRRVRESQWVWVAVAVRHRQRCVRRESLWADLEFCHNSSVICSLEQSWAVGLWGWAHIHSNSETSFK